MKLKFLPFVFILTIFLNACSEDEEFVKQQQSFNLEYLKSNNNFRNYDLILNKINLDQKKTSYTFDSAIFESLIVKDNLTNQETLELNSMLEYLGFDSRQSFDDYIYSVAALVNDLKSTDYFTLDSQIQREIWSSYYASLPSESCEGIRDAERQLARTNHTLGIVACTGTSIGLAGFIGPFAIVFQGGCVGAVLDNFNAEMALINARYQDCIGN